MVKTTEFNIQTQMNYVVGNMSGFTAAYTGMNNLSALISSLMTSYTTMAGTGRAAYLSLGAAAAAFGLKSAEAFGEYQRGMNMVKAISNNTNAQMQMLAKSAGDFSSQFRMGIEDINSGLVTLGRAGLTDVNNQIQVLQNGLEVAKISGMDLASTLEDIVTTTSLLGGDIKSNTFGAETKEVSNLLVATSLSGPLNVSDVIETLKFAGGSAAAAGATLSNEEGLHDLLGTIGAFSQKGVTGSIAGTALRAFITKPASQDQKVSDALAKLGLDAYSLWEKDPEQGWHMKPIAEQIGMITKAMDKNHLTNLDRIEVWGDIVGNKMGQQMLKLDENRIKETTKDIEHQRNLEDIYQGTLTNFASQVERLNQVLQAIYRNLGSGFANNLTPIVKGLADFLEFINGILNGTVFKFLAAIIGPLGLAGLAKGLQDVALVVREFKQNIKESQMTPILEQDLWKGAWGVDIKQLQKIVDRERRDAAYKKRSQRDQLDLEDSDEYWSRWEEHQKIRDDIYYNKLNTKDPAYDERQERHMTIRDNAYIEMMERVKEQQMKDYRSRTEAMSQLESLHVGANVVNLYAKNLVSAQNNMVSDNQSSLKEDVNIPASATKITNVVDSLTNRVIDDIAGTYIKGHSVYATDIINNTNRSIASPYNREAREFIMTVEAGFRSMEQLSHSISWEDAINFDESGNLHGTILKPKMLNLLEDTFAKTLTEIGLPGLENVNSMTFARTFNEVAKEIALNEHGYYDSMVIGDKEKGFHLKPGEQQHFFTKLVQKASERIFAAHFKNIPLTDETIFGKKYKGLGYSEEEAKKYFGGTNVSFRQLIEGRNNQSLDTRGFQSFIAQIGSQNEGIDQKALDNIADRLIFSRLGLVGQHSFVGRKMSSILNSEEIGQHLGKMGEGVSSEIDEIVNTFNTRIPELEKISGVSATKIVYGFVVKGLGRQSPGKIAKAIKAEINDAIKFISDFGAKLRNAAFRLGKSINDSFITGFKTNSIIKSLQKQIDLIQTLLIEQQTILSSLMNIVARDSVLSFAMGFNENGLANIIQTEFALILEETTLFKEKFATAMYLVGFAGQEAYKMGMGIHSPGYIYLATKQEYNLVSMLINDFESKYAAGGATLGQALSSWTKHRGSEGSKLKFGEYLIDEGFMVDPDQAAQFNNLTRPTAQRLLNFDEEEGLATDKLRYMNEDIKQWVQPFHEFSKSKNPILVLDFETTDNSGMAQVIQAGFTNLDDKILKNSESFLINSQRGIRAAAVATHGITNEEKRQGFRNETGEKFLSEVKGYTKILDTIINQYDKYDGLVLGAHNASFDKSVLLSNLARLEPELGGKKFGKSGMSFSDAIKLLDEKIQWVDSYIYAQGFDNPIEKDGLPRFFKFDKKTGEIMPSFSNEALGRSYHTDGEQLHDAEYDTRITAKILDGMRKTITLSNGRKELEVIGKAILDSEAQHNGYFKRREQLFEQSNGKIPIEDALNILSPEIGNIAYEIANDVKTKGKAVFDGALVDLVYEQGKTIVSRVRSKFGSDDYYPGGDKYNTHDGFAEGESKLLDFQNTLVHDILGGFEFNEISARMPTFHQNVLATNEALSIAMQGIQDIYPDFAKNKTILLSKDLDEFGQTITQLNHFLKRANVEYNPQTLGYNVKNVYDKKTRKWMDKPEFKYFNMEETPEGYKLNLAPFGYVSELLNSAFEGKQNALDSVKNNASSIGLINAIITAAMGGSQNVNIGKLGNRELTLYDYLNQNNLGFFSDEEQAAIIGNYGRYGYRNSGVYNYDTLSDEQKMVYGSEVLDLPFQEKFESVEDLWSIYSDIQNEDLDSLFSDYGFTAPSEILEEVISDADNVTYEGLDRLLNEDFFDRMEAAYDGEGLEASHLSKEGQDYILKELGIDINDRFLKSLLSEELDVQGINNLIQSGAITKFMDERKEIARKNTLNEEVYDLNPSDFVDLERKHFSDEGLQYIWDNMTLESGDSVEFDEITEAGLDALDEIKNHANYILDDKKEQAWESYKNDQNSTEISDHTYYEDYDGKSERIFNPYYNDPRVNYALKMFDGLKDSERAGMITKLKYKVNNLLGAEFWSTNENAIKDLNFEPRQLKSFNPFLQYNEEQLRTIGRSIEDEFIKKFPNGAVYYAGSYDDNTVSDSSYHTINELPVFKQLLDALHFQTKKANSYRYRKDTFPPYVRKQMDKIIAEAKQNDDPTKLNDIKYRHLKDVPSGLDGHSIFKETMATMGYRALKAANIKGVNPSDIFSAAAKHDFKGDSRFSWNQTEWEENQAWQLHWPKVMNWRNIFKRKQKEKSNDPELKKERLNKYFDNLDLDIEQGLVKQGQVDKKMRWISRQVKLGLKEIQQTMVDERRPLFDKCKVLGMSIEDGVKIGAGMSSPPRILTQLIKYIADVPVQIREQAGPVYTAMYEWGLSFVKGVKAGTQMASPPKVLTELLTYLKETESLTEASISRINTMLIGVRNEMGGSDYILDEKMIADIDKVLADPAMHIQRDKFGRLKETLKEAKNTSQSNIITNTEQANVTAGLKLLEQRAQFEENIGKVDRANRNNLIDDFEKRLHSGRFDNDRITDEMMESLGLKQAAEEANLRTKQGLNADEYRTEMNKVFDDLKNGVYNSYNEVMLDVYKLNEQRKAGIVQEQEILRLQKMKNREEKYGLLGKGLNAIGTGLPKYLGQGVSYLGKGLSGMMSLMMNPYIMGAEMLWGFIQQAIDILKQQEQEKIAKLSEITSEAESAFDEQQSKWEEAQSKDNEKFGDLSDNEKQDKMLDAIAQGREDFNNASAETKALIGKQNELISANNNLIDQKMSNWITGYNGLEANYTEFMEGSGMYGTKDEFGFMDFLGSILDPNKLTDNSNTRRLDALTESDIQIDTRVKNMEEFTEDYQQVMASMGLAHRSLLDIYNVRGIMQESELSGTFFDQSTSNAMRIGSPTLMSPEKLAGIMKQQEKILQRFENRYLRFMKAGTGKDRHIEVTLGDGSIHKLAQQLGLKDIEAAQVLAVHQLQRIQDVMLNQVEPQLAQQTLGIYQNTYQLGEVNKESDVQSVFQNTMSKGILAIQMQVAQLVYKAAMEQALQDYQAETGDTETNTVGLLLNKARDTSAENHELAKKYSARGWGSYLQSRDINALVNQGYTEEQAIQKLAQEKGVSVDQLTNAYAQSSYDELGKYDYNGTERWLKNNATWLIPAAMAVVGGAAGTVLGPIGTIGGAELGSGIGTAALAAMGLSEVTIGATGTALVGGAAGLTAGAGLTGIGGAVYQGVTDGLTDFSDPFTEHTNEMMRSYANSIPLDSTTESLNDAQTAADSEGDNGQDTDTSDADKQRYVQLAICNKKAIPKLNVNLFKKAPTFTVLNKNFKLRDIKINTADKAKNIENSLKNAIIDVQERSDPKIIQDSEAEYDPVGATDDATNLPTGASLTK